MSYSIGGLNRYEKLFGASGEESADKMNAVTNRFAEKYATDSDELRKERSKATDRDADKGIVQDYYSIATDLYEYGWGESFHFGIRWKDSTFEDAIRRYEYVLPLRMRTKPGDLLLDMGCGVGGPMRNIARFARCNVVGVNISPYQVFRANTLCEEAGLKDQCRAVVGDFTKLEFEDNTFDGVYGIESTCHTADKHAVYSEAFRVLKPGAYFTAWEWVTTPKFDPNNEEHKKIRFGIEMGNGLPETVPGDKVLEALREVGFEIEDHFDGTEHGEEPWWLSVAGDFSLYGFARSNFGMWFVGYMLAALEKIRVVPPGIAKAQDMLCVGARSLVKGGKLGIYSTMYFVLARKPEK